MSHLIYACPACGDWASVTQTANKIEVAPCKCAKENPNA